MMKVVKMSPRRKLIIGTSVVLATVAILIGICAIYVNDYYHADTEAISQFSAEYSVTKQIWEDNVIVYQPENPKAGFIFYPGGKVEYTAYEPLMEACASKGILCVLVKMPFNLAVLDMNAAKGIPEQFPEIRNWYIGGHSLGGSMAASYIGENIDSFDGLILLGSYSTTDLSQSSLNVLSIYGSEDKVLNHENYTECQSNLPANFTEIIIEGGCHAYFGMYGAQEGDGIPTISNIEQIEQTAEYIDSNI